MYLTLGSYGGMVSGPGMQHQMMQQSQQQQQMMRQQQQASMGGPMGPGSMGGPMLMGQQQPPSHMQNHPGNPNAAPQPNQASLNLFCLNLVFKKIYTFLPS
jgi:hypothetical protein